MTRQDKTSQAKAKQNGPNKARPRPSKARRDKTRHDMTRVDKGKAKQHPTRQDMAIQDKTLKDKARPGKTREASHKMQAKSYTSTYGKARTSLITVNQFYLSGDQLRHQKEIKLQPLHDNPLSPQFNVECVLGCLVVQTTPLPDFYVSCWDVRCQH